MPAAFRRYESVFFATMIKENLVEGVIGLDNMLAAGLVYAHNVGNPSLAQKLRALGARELPDLPTQTLARAISSSPAAVDRSVIESSRSCRCCTGSLVSTRRPFHDRDRT